MMGDRARRARESVGPVVLALLLVTTLASPLAAGLASAQTYEKTVTGSPEFVVMDTTELSAGEFTLEVVVEEAPGGGSAVIYRETKTVAEVPDEWVFRNAKAYKNVTFRVSGVDTEPDMGPGSGFRTTTWTTASTFLATGGDRDFGPGSCDLDERLASSVNPTYQDSDCHYTLPGTTSVNSTGLDAEETKVEIYQSAATQSDSAENFQTMLRNRLQDTETVSLVKGKGAYIRKLNEGSSRSASKAEATENITQYYSNIERNTLSEWNSQMSNIKFLRSLAENESGVSKTFVDVPVEDTQDGDTGSGADDTRVQIVGWGSRTVSLQNGQTVNATTVDIEIAMEFAGTWETGVYTVGPKTGTVIDASYSSDQEGNDRKDVTFNRISVEPPNNNYDRQEVVRFQDYSNRFSEIDSQTTSAINSMETVVNQTYDSYQTGTINSSDIVDPYVLQSEFSPGSEYQGWAAANLAMLGTNQPTDLDQTGYMEINISGGPTVEGVLQAGGNPPGGEFVVGETYDPANVTGSVFVTTDSQVREVTSPFTLENATTVDGEQRANVTIEKKTYETTSAEDLQALNQELSLLREEINAREDNLNSGGGGGGLLGGGSDAIVLLLVAGAVAAVILSQNNGRR